MKFTKPFISIDDQIALLQSRGLLINDIETAKKFLLAVSYYRLRAYTFPFQDNSSQLHPFQSNTTFEQITASYFFDSKLRLIIFAAIEKIEIALRTQIIYQLAKVHGSHWQADPSLFKDVPRFVKHLDTLNKEIERSNETFIDHYNNKYTSPSQPPCWMSLEVASLGTLSKFYQNLKKDIAKEEVANYFGLKDVGILENWMFCFSSIRNICAHHGRLWNRRMTALPKLSYNTQSPFLTKAETKSIYPNKLYATLCCINYILFRINQKDNFTKEIVALISNQNAQQIKEMGFEPNWQSHVLWTK